MALVRLAHHEGLYVKDFFLHSEAVVAATVIEIGDLVKYQSETDPLLSGVALADLVTEDQFFVGVSMGKTTATMISGAHNDHIPVAMKCIIEVDLVSANYNFGDMLAWQAKNKLEAAAATSKPGIAWFYGRDENTITRGLVLIDVMNVSGLSTSVGLFENI